jgi:hypothetical protein
MGVAMNGKKLSAKMLGGKLLIAAPVALAGGKSTMGTSRLTLDEFPRTNASVCYDVNQQINNAQAVPDNLTVAIPASATSVKMAFTVGDVVANGKNQMLFLIYSNTRITTSATISSSVSDYQVGVPLDSTLGVLGVYNLPAISSQPQSASAIGTADPAVKSKLVFDVTLDPAKIAALKASGKNQLFFQAGLINEADYKANNYSGMLLSEVDTISFIQGACPAGNANITASNTGGKTVTSANNTANLSKSSATTNAGGKISVPSATSTGTSGKSPTSTGTSTGGKTFGSSTTPSTTTNSPSPGGK